MKKHNVEQLFNDHEKLDEKRFNAAKSRDQGMSKKLDKILGNHLAHMEPDLAALKEIQSVQNETLKWQNKLLIGILGGIGSLFITVIAGVAIAFLTKFV